MITESELVRLILGLKVQFLRREKGLSYQQLSEQTGLAISYLHNIEKGKKHPKADKIFALAKALDTDYNYLVSLKADKKLRPVVELLKSDFLKLFPLETFGISIPKLIELLMMAPDKVNAFISTVLKITRNFNLQGEDFYKAALRSYQDLHDNYFPEIEAAVHGFRAEHGLTNRVCLREEELVDLLDRRFGIQVDRDFLPSRPELSEIRSYYAPPQRTLYLNDNLKPAQVNFLLAKEVGYQVLELHERPYETRMVEVDNFEKLLANFRTSYFAVALLVEETAIIQEIENMSRWPRWDNEAFLDLLDRFTLTPEMLLQRLANVLPRHFGIKDLFFLRFYTVGPDLRKFEMTKEMHLSQLHNPHANQLDEHYCRRWISINLIRKLKALQGVENWDGPIAGAQVSRYWNTDNHYLCICLAKPTRDDARNSSSVTIGLLVNDKLRQLFPWIDAPDMTVKDVNTTCERCPISDCNARAAAPIVLQRGRAKAAIRAGLAEMERSLR